MNPQDAVFDKLSPKVGLSIVHLYRELGGVISLVDVKQAIKQMIKDGIVTSKVEGIIPVYFSIEGKHGKAKG